MVKWQYALLEWKGERQGKVIFTEFLPEGATSGPEFTVDHSAFHQELAKKGLEGWEATPLSSTSYFLKRQVSE